jgi:hypothetical protein
VLSIDPEKTIVILVGSSEYPDDSESLPELPSVRNNIEDFSRLLKDPTIIGVPEKNILVIQDQPNASGVATKIALKAKEATDTLIFYYAGHGVIGRDTTELHLAVRDTTDVAVDYNAIPISQIKKAIYNSPAKRKIMILDCCYSGRALDIMSSEESLVRETIDLKGTYAIASAPADRPASAPKNEKHTVFTGELLRLIEQGVENGKDGITLNEIYENVRLELKRRPNIPAPQRANFQDADKLVICRNRKMILSDIESKIAKLQESLVSRLNAQDERIENFIKVQNVNFQELKIAIEEAHLGSHQSASKPPSSVDYNKSYESILFRINKTARPSSIALISGAIIYIFPFWTYAHTIGLSIAGALLVLHILILAFSFGSDESRTGRILRIFFGYIPFDVLIRYTCLSMIIMIAAFIYRYIQYMSR